MLILGVDRDNSEVAPEYDELNPAVCGQSGKLVTTCAKNKSLVLSVARRLHGIRT